MNGTEKIAYNNIVACFNYEVGGWYNCIQDNCTQYIPETEKDAKEFIYESAINDRYGNGYCGIRKAPREMRFAGEKFIRETIDKLFAEDDDIASIREVKNW